MKRLFFATVVSAFSVIFSSAYAADFTTAPNTIPNSIPTEQRRLSDANIFGHIIDAETGEHIPYVTVSVKGTTVGAVADATGHYIIQNMPVGEYTLVAEIIGYGTVEQPVKTIKGKSIEVNFTLKQEALDMDAVVVEQVTSNLMENAVLTSPVDVNAQDQLLLLITCVDDDNERRILAARRVRENETEQELIRQVREGFAK